jgi:hypothetical protein
LEYQVPQQEFHDVLKCKVSLRLTRTYSIRAKRICLAMVFSVMPPIAISSLHYSCPHLFILHFTCLCSFLKNTHFVALKIVKLCVCSPISMSIRKNSRIEKQTITAFHTGESY